MRDLRRVALAASLLCACFSEPVLDPGEGGTTGPACPQGTMGCACYGNHTCDLGLECEHDVNACIPAECQPGTRYCSCDAGACVTPLVCDDGLCVDDSPSTVGTSSGTGTDETAAPDSTANADATSMPGTTAADTTGPDPQTTDDTGDSSSTGAPPSCDDQGDCETCLTCVDAPGASCEDTHAACMQTGGCVNAVTCLSDCGLTGICFEDCCQGLGAAQVVAVNAEMFCRKDHCTDSCGQYRIPVCG